MDDVYRDRQDPAVTVTFELETGELAAHLDHHPVDAAGQPGDRRRADIDYAVMEEDGGRYSLPSPVSVPTRASWPAPPGSVP